jgi:hypothetical protein
LNNQQKPLEIHSNDSLSHATPEALNRLERQLYNDGSATYNTVTPEEVEILKQILTEDYRVIHNVVDHETWLQSNDTKILINKIGVNKIQNLYNIDSPLGIPETNLNPETQMARWKSGIPLETAVGHSLTYAGISFIGNPLDPKKYPHASKGVHSDIKIPDSNLIECVNMSKSTWLEDDIMLEKIGYFHKDDPQHNMQWTIITSYDNWNKRIDKAINEDKITVIVLNQKVHKQNINRVQDELAPILSTLHKEGITNNLLHTIYKQNNKKLNMKQIEYRKLKTLYQLIVNTDFSTIEGGCGPINSTNIGCLSAG